MSNYTPTLTNSAGATKDSTHATILATELGTEFDAIQTAVNSKVDSGGALGTPTTGTLTSCTGLPLTTGVTGTLPIANGGTGNTTASAAFAALKQAATTGATGVVQLAQNSDVAAGSSSSLSISPSTLLSLFGASTRATSGTARIPVNIAGAFAEIILNWGQDNVTANTSTDIVMHTAFPTGAIIAFASKASMGTTGASNVQCVPSATPLTKVTLTNADGTTSTINWLAIGY